jgi:hypothetical protein
MLRMIGLLLVSLASCGCSLYENFARTSIVEPLQFCTPKQKYKSKLSNRALAEAVWQEVVLSDPGPYTPDYADGFQDGFADFLFAGGNGLPPPVPPRRYWKLEYQHPPGRQAVLDWYAGFRHGTLVAQESGQRLTIIVPSSLPPSQWAPAEVHGLETLLPPPLPVAPWEDVPAPSVAPGETPK